MNEGGIALPYRRADREIGKYGLRIRALRAQGLSDKAIAAQLKREHPTKKTPSHSGISAFLAKHGVKIDRWASGRVRVASLDLQIREMLAAGKGKELIARELGKKTGVSRSGIIGYINRLERQTVSGNPGQCVESDARNP